MLAVCTSIEIGGERRPLGGEERERCTETFRRLSANGLRVLAVAYRQVDRAEGWNRADECDLALAGFLTFLDPPIEGVADTIAALRGMASESRFSQATTNW